MCEKIFTVNFTFLLGGKKLCRRLTFFLESKKMKTPFEQLVFQISTLDFQPIPDTDNSSIAIDKLKERVLRLILRNGGTISRTALIRSLHLRKAEADKLIGELKPYIRINKSETLGRPVTIYHYCPNGAQ